MDKNNLSKIRVKLWVALIQAFNEGGDVASNLVALPKKIVSQWQSELYSGATLTEQEVNQFLLAQLGGIASSEAGGDFNAKITQLVAELGKLPAAERQFLTINAAACNRCDHNAIWVTNLCRGCRARPCQEACRFGAMSMQQGRAVIDQAKCKKCLKCVKVCSYSAIVKRLAPCVDACPVGAISKDVNSIPAIDFNKCIHCGQCDAACHFGAITERSQLLKILTKIKSGAKVIAMLAPSIVGQCDGNIRQIASGLIKLGFYKVAEVAVGADETSINEAKEWHERVIEHHAPFMTTSCCTAYTELVKRHIPQLAPLVSNTLTPMAYIARKMRARYPDAVTVFVGPCVAKRAECFDDPNIDAVMEYEELNACFLASGIVPSQLAEYSFEDQSSHEARNFGLTQGVATAVAHLVTQDQNQLKPYYISGLDKLSVQQLKTFATENKCQEGNLVEVMACRGGCVGGPHAAKPSQAVVNEVQTYAATGASNLELMQRSAKATTS